jgi:hypothetical protein
MARSSGFILTLAVYASLNVSAMVWWIMAGVAPWAAFHAGLATHGIILALAVRRD